MSFSEDKPRAFRDADGDLVVDIPEPVAPEPVPSMIVQTGMGKVGRGLYPDALTQVQQVGRGLRTARGIESARAQQQAELTEAAQSWWSRLADKVLDPRASGYRNSAPIQHYPKYYSRTPAHAIDPAMTDLSTEFSRRSGEYRNSLSTEVPAIDLNTGFPEVTQPAVPKEVWDTLAQAQQQDVYRIGARSSGFPYLSYPTPPESSMDSRILGTMEGQAGFYQDGSFHPVAPVAPVAPVVPLDPALRPSAWDDTATPFRVETLETPLVSLEPEDPQGTLSQELDYRRRSLLLTPSPIRPYPYVMGPDGRAIDTRPAPVAPSPEADPPLPF